jgi:hypothetical protein
MQKQTINTCFVNAQKKIEKSGEKRKKKNISPFWLLLEYKQVSMHRNGPIL